METEYLGNAYTTQSSNDGCVAVACPIDAGCAINAGNTQDLSSIELEPLIPRVILSIKHTHSTIG